MKKILAILAAAIAAVVLMCSTVLAFDGNDYDYGGGGDWGGGGGFTYDYDNDSSGGGGGGSLGIGGAIVVIVIVVIILAVSKNKGNGSTAQGGVVKSAQGRFVNLPDRTAEIENIIKRNDPNFSASDFVSFTKEVYIDIQTAWCKRDLTPVRPVLHENLYNTTARQVQSKIDQGVIYHYESIAINTAYLTSYARDAQFEFLTCYLNARMIDYQTDEKTGNILRGDKNTRWDMRYKMKFVRSVGVQTKQETSAAHGHNCPNCGAPLEITSSGVCEYCGSVVTTGQYSWVLTDFTTVRNDTVDEGIHLPPEPEVVEEKPIAEDTQAQNNNETQG
ncbi:MAG: Tim44 domain-containing protein [Eubacterium sp.]|nr:Tim44 domain-containing protein [Eubacterium sp.]